MTLRTVAWQTSEEAAPDFQAPLDVLRCNLQWQSQAQYVLVIPKELDLASLEQNLEAEKSFSSVAKRVALRDFFAAEAPRRLSSH